MNDRPDHCPTCGCPLPDTRHIVDQANRTLRAHQQKDATT